MDTLLEVGFVEALAAVLFVGFCLFISYLLQPRKVYERRLSQMLDQIAQPERPVPPQLTYRGAHYAQPPAEASNEAPAEQSSSSSEVKPSDPKQVPHSVVRLTYRGVPYIQVKGDSDDPSSAP